MVAVDGATPTTHTGDSIHPMLTLSNTRYSLPNQKLPTPPQVSGTYVSSVRG